jgi:aminocarboxymuconate-semialdehyde decarboxylase
VIDFHTHVVVDLPDFSERFGDPRWPTFSREGAVGQLVRDGQVVRSLAPCAWLPDERIADMDAAGVDRQVLSPTPPLICDFGDPGPSSAWADHLNEAIADIVRTYPDRFCGLGTVPLHHPEGAIAVLERAKQAGLAGIEIGTTAGGKELDDSELTEFYQAAEELGMVVFVHPLLLGRKLGWTDRITSPASVFGLGMGTDTAMAATRLVFGGVTRHCPGLRVCLAHGGGTFVWALPRITRMSDQLSEVPAVDSMRNVFVDSVVYRAENLRYLCDVIGSTHVLFGTDYPLPAQADIAGAILTSIAAADADNIAGRNAAALLGL